jgi:hypothetical protein
MAVVELQGSQNQGPPTKTGGAWVHGGDGGWTWTPGATPNPDDVSKWGLDAITNITRDPAGNRNHGAWTPSHGGGWQWTWGANPDPNLVDKYGKGPLTDPDHAPNGADTKDQNSPLPADVKAPDLADAWHGTPPAVTGNVPGATNDSSTTVDHPPDHPAFMVSPGSIRNAETVLLQQIDTQINEYTALKNYVQASLGQNLYMEGATHNDFQSIEDHLLLGIGDAVELAGQFTQMLNITAQSYAKADIDSFLPST